MIKISSIEKLPAPNEPVAVVCTDKEVHQCILRNGGIRFHLCDSPNQFISSTQIIGWALLSELTHEEKGYINSSIEREQWEFAPGTPKFMPIEFESQGVPANNTIVTLLLPSGMLIEAETRSDGFVPTHDFESVGDKGYFTLDDINGWARQKDLSSIQRAFIGEKIKNDKWCF